MAGAMARGWAGADGGPDGMLFADAGSGRAADLAQEVGGEAVADVGKLRERSDVIVLAVKRTALDAVAHAIGGDVPPLISVLAGVSVAELRDTLGDAPVLRAMPNVAVEVRRGIVCYVQPNEDFPHADRALGLLGLLGATVSVDEGDLDAATAVMSCSPAYIALVSETLAEAGEREGLSADVAHELVVDALAGTAELLRRRDPEAIRQAVASPGGATEAGLDALAERDLEAAVHEAVRASLERMRA